MTMGEDRFRSRTLIALETRCEQMQSPTEHLEAIFEPDVKDAGAVGAAQLVERLRSNRYARLSPASQLGEHDIPSLLQEALEEGAPDRKLTQVVAALGLLLASLDSPSRK
jgi:ferritin-like metal-binding protein YciE